MQEETSCLRSESKEPKEKWPEISINSKQKQQIAFYGKIAPQAKLTCSAISLLLTV